MIDSHRDEIAKLEALYASNPEGRVFTHLAEACRKAGQLERAREILEDGLGRHPDYASAHVVLGRVLLDSGDEAGSAGEFRRVLELDRHNLVALRSLGDLASKGDSPDEALYYYGELAVLDPTDMVIQEEMKRLRERVTDAEAGTKANEAPAAEPSASASETTQDTGHETGEESDRAEERGAESAEPAGFQSMSSWGDESSEVGGKGSDTTEETAYPRMSGLESVGDDAGDATGGDSDEASFADIDINALHAAAEPTTPADEATTAAFSGFPSDAGLTIAEADGADGPASPDAGTDGDPAEATSAHGDEDEPGEAGALGAVAEDTDAVADADAVDSDADAASPDDADEPVTADPDVDPDSARAWHGAEGRWDEPAGRAADEDAERQRTASQDTGEWIPQDRWQWVSASAGDRTESEDEAETDTDPSSESVAEEAQAEARPSWLSEGSLSDLELGDAADLSTGPDDVAETVEADLETEPPEARPVDSFEEGALDVLAASGLMDADPDDSAPGDRPDTDAAADESGQPEEAGPAAGSGADGSDWESPSSEDSGDQVITETLAEIYASQGLIERAVSVYRRLVRTYPDDDRLQVRLTALESSMRQDSEEEAPDSGGEDREAWLARVESAFTGGQGAAPDGATPYAWPAADEPEDASAARIGDFFRTLLDWRPAAESAPPPPAALEEPAVELEEVSAPETDVVSWATSPAEAADPDGRTGESQGEDSAESDEDLEMFRSWLKSLKK